MKNSKKMLIAVVALVIAIATATSATFAWFALGNTASVDAFNIGVTSGTTNLLMSVDGGATYGTTFTAQQLLEGNDYLFVEEGGAKYLASYQKDAAGTFNKFVKDVDDTDIVYSIETTMEGYTMEPTNKYAVKRVQYELVTPDGAPVAGEQAFKREAAGSSDTSNYVKLTIKFKAEASKQQRIVLLDDADSDGVARLSEITAVGAAPRAVTYQGAAEIANTQYGKTIAVGSTFATRAAYAARVGFIGTTDGAAFATTMNVWAPYDWANIADIGTVAPAMTSPAESYYIGNLQADYKTAAGNPSTWASLVPATRTTVINNVVATDDNTDVGTATTLTLTTTAAAAGFYTADLNIYIWIEGNDGDAFNAILEDFFAVKMAFASFDVA